MNEYLVCKSRHHVLRFEIVVGGISGGAHDLHGVAPEEGNQVLPDEACELCLIQLAGAVYSAANGERGDVFRAGQRSQRYVLEWGKLCGDVAITRRGQSLFR